MGEKRQTTTVSVYAEDAAALREVKLDEQKQADQLAAIVHDYFKRRQMTHGQSVAADAVALIQVQTAKLCELVENAARVAADESKAVVQHANEQVEAAKAALDEERTAHKTEVDDLKSRLAAAEAEAKELRQNLENAKAEFSALRTENDQLKEQFNAVLGLKRQGVS